MSLSRRELIKFLALTCLPLPAFAKSFHIVMLLFRGETEAERGFLTGLKESGINAKITTLDCDRDLSKLPSFIQQIRTLQPDLVYTFGTTTALAAVSKKDTQEQTGVGNIPVVYNIVADPIGAGLTDSLDASHRNSTGVSHLAPLETQIAVLLQVQKIRSLGFIYNEKEKNSALTLDALQVEANKTGFRIVAHAFNGDNTQATLGKILAEKPDFLYLPSDSSVIVQATEICREAHAAGVPTFSATEGPVRKSGAYVGLVTPYFTAGKFAAHKAKQILEEGKPAGTIPIESVTRFRLLLNMESAHQLDLYPPVKLMRFTEVVQKPVTAS